MRNERRDLLSPWVTSHDQCGEAVAAAGPGVFFACGAPAAGWRYELAAYAFVPACEAHMEIPAGDDGKPDWRRAGQAALALLALA